MRKTYVTGLLFITGLLLAACQTTTPTNTTTTTSPTPVAVVTGAATPIAVVRSVTGTNTIENKDGSTTVVTNYSDGSKSEVRTFKTGRLTRVTRETPAGGTLPRRVRVVHRDDNAEVDVEDPNWVEKSMDATGDALATAASKTKAGVKTAASETADKAADVGNAVKKGAKKGASETADKAEDVGDAVKKGVKKGASETADKAEDVGGAIKKGAKKTGKFIKDVVTPDKKSN